MNSVSAKAALEVARRIQAASSPDNVQPSETTASSNQPVLPNSLFFNTRGYLQSIVYQINRSYEHTCYDACAVMIRRLVEILIIECFENHQCASKIKNPSDDYLYLDDLISCTLAENWGLGRNTKLGLRKLKRIGDQSAHSRRYNARREYVDDVIIDLRTVAEELLYVAALKR